MICKHLEKMVKVVPDEEKLEIERPIELEYYLLESTPSDPDGDLYEKKIYGFEIIKSIDDRFAENMVVKDFSCCREKALKLLEKFVCNVVTPIELPYLLDDIIGV